MLLFRDTRFGGAKRLYHLAEEMARHAEVRILCLDGCGEMDRFLESRKDPAGRASLPALLPIEADFRKSLLVRRFGMTIDVSDDFLRQSASIEAFLGPGRFDTLLLAYPIALSFMPTFWAGRCDSVAYLEDDLTLETTRKAYADSGHPIHKAWKRFRHGQVLRYYRARLERATTLIAISGEESAILSGYLPGRRIAIVKHGLPPGEYPFLTAPERRDVLGFIGNYRHPPNADALARLLGDWFPRMRKALPGLRLHVAGRFIPEGLASPHRGDPDIAFFEDVSDLREFYRNIGVFANSIVSGRGLRTKLIESAAFGRPILSTRLGAEGLEDLRLGIVETGEEALAELRKVLDPAVYAATAAFNRRRFEEEYSLEKVGGRLLRALGAAPEVHIPAA